MIHFKCLRCGEVYAIPRWIAGKLSYKAQVYCNDCYRLRVSKDKPFMARLLTRQISESPFKRL